MEGFQTGFMPGMTLHTPPPKASTSELLSASLLLLTKPSQLYLRTLLRCQCSRSFSERFVSPICVFPSALKRIRKACLYLSMKRNHANVCQAGVKDVITLFHAPKNPSSIRVYTLLKQTAGTAQSTATEDQASSHDQHSKLQRTEFDLRR